MRENIQQFEKELSEYVLNPIRIIKISELYQVDLIDLLEYY